MSDAGRIDVTSGMTREELKEMADTLLDNLTRLTEAVCKKYPMRWWERSGAVDAAIHLIERFVP